MIQFKGIDVFNVACRFLFCLFLLGALSVQAATVTSLADSGPGSLRQALSDAASGEVIDFSVTGTINLSSRLTINQPVTIRGPGADLLSISAQGLGRVMHIPSSGVFIESLTIRDGVAIGGDGGDSETGGGGGGGGGEGGAVFTEVGSAVRFIGVRFVNNHARGGNGGSSGVSGAGADLGAPGLPAGGLGSSGGGFGVSPGLAGGGAANDIPGSARAQMGGRPRPNLTPGAPAPGGGAGAGLGGAIFSQGFLALDRCVFESNSARMGQSGLNHFEYSGFSLSSDGGFNPVDADATRRGSAVFAAAGGLVVLNEIQFGLNSRVNAQGQTPQFPTNPAAFIQGEAAIHPQVPITRSAGPAAQVHPVLDISGQPRLPYIFRNIADRDADVGPDFENTFHFGQTVTRYLQALNGFQVVDSNTSLAQMGIAVTGIDTSNGTWDYRLSGGPTEYVLIEDVSEGNALLLPPDAFLRFTAYPEYTTETGVEPFVSFRAWDEADNIALAGTRADTSSNGAGTRFSEEIARVHQPVDVALKWRSQYIELPAGSEQVTVEVNNDPDPPEIRGLASLSRYEVATAGNPNQASTFVGVGGAYAAGPFVTSEILAFYFDHESGPGQVASGVLQMSSVGTPTFDGFGAQSIFQAPVILHGQTQITAVSDMAVGNEDEVLEVSPLSNDVDPDSADALQLISVLVSERGVTPSVDGDMIRYTPRENFHGSDSFLYLVSSQDGLRYGVGLVEVEILPVNDAPVLALADNLVVVNEDSGSTTIADFVTQASAGTELQRDELGNLRTVDADGNLTEGRPESVDQILSMELTLVSQSPTLTFDAGPSIDLLTGALSFTPSADGFGTAVFDAFLRDSGPGESRNVNVSSAQRFTIQIDAINDAPFFTLGVDPAVNEDQGPQNITAFASAIGAGAPGEDAQNLQFIIVGNDNPGLFSVLPSLDEMSGDLSFSTTADASGVATIDVALMDDGGTSNGGIDTSAVERFTISVAAVNDAPSFIIGASTSILEDAGPQLVSGFGTILSTGPGDEAGQIADFLVTANDNPGLFSSPPQIDSASGNLSYTVTPNANGSASITVVVMDDGGTANGGSDTSPPQTFTINVDAVNDRPVFILGADPAVLEDAGPQSITAFATGIAGGPPDESAQALTFEIVNNDNPGLFSVAPSLAASDGRLVFTPAPDQNGVANVTLRLVDDGGTANGGFDTSLDQAFAINITAVNDSPSFVVGPDQTVFSDAGPQTIDPWATDLSVGPANESTQSANFVVVGNSDPAVLVGDPTISSTGALSFTPAAGAMGSTLITIEYVDDGGAANGGSDTSPAQSFLLGVMPPLADLVLTIGETAQTQPGVGETYDYQLLLENQGPGAPTNVSVEIDFPANLSLQDPGACVTDNGDGTLSWAVGPMMAGSAENCQFGVRIEAPGPIVLTATAISNLDDPDPANNVDIESRIVSGLVPVPALGFHALLLMIGFMWLGLWAWGAFRGGRL